MIETADDILRIIRESDCKNVKAMFDTCHVWYRNDPLLDYVKKLEEHLIHIHIEGPVAASERQTLFPLSSTVAVILWL